MQRVERFRNKIRKGRFRYTCRNLVTIDKPINVTRRLVPLRSAVTSSPSLHWLPLLLLLQLLLPLRVSCPDFSSSSSPDLTSPMMLLLLALLDRTLPLFPSSFDVGPISSTLLTAYILFPPTPSLSLPGAALAALAVDELLSSNLNTYSNYHTAIHAHAYHTRQYGHAPRGLPCVAKEGKRIASSADWNAPSAQMCSTCR